MSYTDTRDIRIRSYRGSIGPVNRAVSSNGPRANSRHVVKGHINDRESCVAQAQSLREVYKG